MRSRGLGGPISARCPRRGAYLSEFGLKLRVEISGHSLQFVRYMSDLFNCDALELLIGGKLR